MWYMWKSKFTELIDVHAPLKTRKVGKKVQPWITKEILVSKKNKNFLKKKASKTIGVQGIGKISNLHVIFIINLLSRPFGNTTVLRLKITTVT